MIFRRKALVCQQAVELVTDYLEGALSTKDRKRVEAHLAGCPLCTEYFAQIRETIEATGSVDVRGLPQQTQDDLVTFFEQYRS